MKRLSCLFLVVIMTASLAGCGGTYTLVGASYTKASYNNNDLESMLDAIETTEENASEAMEKDYNTITELLGDSYSTYSEHKDSVAEFYEASLENAQSLYTELSNIEKDYLRCVAANGLDDEWLDSIGDLYDQLRDAVYDFYNEWTDYYDDMYDACKDFAEKAPHDDYYDVWNDVYDVYSDAWDDMYDAYNDAWDNMYNMYSDVDSAFWDGKTDIEAILNGTVFETERESIPETETETYAETETTLESTVSSDGLDPDFKAAMDEYEEFYSQYCDIVSQYYDNPSDTELLSAYTELLTQAAEVDEAFYAWDDGELSDDELAYYLEVNNRVLAMISQIGE